MVKNEKNKQKTPFAVGLKIIYIMPRQKVSLHSYHETSQETEIEDSGLINLAEEVSKLLLLDSNF